MSIKLACKHISIQLVYWLFMVGWWIWCQTRHNADLLVSRHSKNFTPLLFHSLLSFFTTFICIITNDSSAVKTTKDETKIWYDGGFTFFWNETANSRLKHAFCLIVMRISEMDFPSSSTKCTCPTLVKFILRPQAFEGFTLEIRITFVAIVFGWVSGCAVAPRLKDKAKD